jgi:amino acid transporter
MGLGSILATGIFVSIGIAAGVAGPSVILAVAAAAVVATFNGLSSAQLAASHPVSGGTYEYGHRRRECLGGEATPFAILCFHHSTPNSISIHRIRSSSKMNRARKVLPASISGNQWRSSCHISW